MNANILSQGLQQLMDKLKHWGEGTIIMIPNLILASVVVFVFWVLSRWVFNLMREIFKKTHFNESLEQLLANVCRVAVITIGIILALAVLELQKTVFSLLAGVGVLGLALGFAFQDLAANFIAGVMLAVRSPLKIADVIEINGVTGTVIEIRLRDTLIRNFAGQDIFIPNKDFTSNKFTNYSSFGMRRAQVEVGIGYEDNPTMAVEIVRKAFAKVDNLLADPAPEAFVTELGGSSVNICGYAWFTYPGGSLFQIQNDAIIQVKKDLEEAGFNIPFPIRTIDLAQDTKEALSTMRPNQV